MTNLESRLYDSIETNHTIKCSKCPKEDFVHCEDIWTAIGYFQKEGWYATVNNVYCSECNLKRKKNGK